MALNNIYCVDVPLHVASGLFMFTLPPKRGTTRKQKLIKKGDTYRSIVTIGLSRTVSEINGGIRRKSPMFPTPLYLTPPMNGFPLEFCYRRKTQKLK